MKTVKKYFNDGRLSLIIPGAILMIFSLGLIVHFYNQPLERAVVVTGTLKLEAASGEGYEPGHPSLDAGYRFFISTKEKPEFGFTEGRKEGYRTEPYLVRGCYIGQFAGSKHFQYVSISEDPGGRTRMKRDIAFFSGKEVEASWTTRFGGPDAKEQIDTWWDCGDLKIRPAGSHSKGIPFEGSYYGHDRVFKKMLSWFSPFLTGLMLICLGWGNWVVFKSAARAARFSERDRCRRLSVARRR